MIASQKFKEVRLKIKSTFNHKHRLRHQGTK